MEPPAAAPRAPTMRDVAVAAGVSKALVSIVFRGAPGSSDETRARVLQVADDLGYRPNRTASLLKLRHTKHLGVTMNVRNAFHAEVVEGIQAAADEAGYQIVLSTVTATHGETRAVDTLLEFRCESVILLGSELSTAALEALARVVPVVMVGRRTSLHSVDVVRTADDHGVGLAVDHLVALGHRRIVHIDGGRGVISADRRRGYRAAMQRHGLRTRLRTISGGPSEEDGWRAAGDLMAIDPLPTAVTVFNDHCALGVIGRVTRAGIGVPERLSVTGYDDAPVAQFTTVNLTTVSQEAATQATWAVRAAVQRLEAARHQPRESLLEPRLVIRGTTAAVPPTPGTA
jgi:DNA-binding LacI/PurR family transcriptional regulator